MGNPIQYRYQSLERITAREIVTSNTLKLYLPRFYLAGSVYAGQFNQAGFVIVDRTPQERPYWGGSNILRYSPQQVKEEIQKHKEYGTGAGIPEEEKYFYDTTRGMAALRFFAVSKQLTDIFEKDDLLGEPMIKKICQDNVVPKDFHELEIFPSDSRKSILEYNPNANDELGVVVNIILGPLKKRTETEYKHFPYVTYFPTQAYGIITQTLEESIQEVVLRSDRFGNQFQFAKKT